MVDAMSRAFLVYNTPKERRDQIESQQIEPSRPTPASYAGDQTSN
jgi:hypothetical protein